MAVVFAFADHRSGGRGQGAEGGGPRSSSMLLAFKPGLLSLPNAIGAGSLGVRIRRGIRTRGYSARESWMIGLRFLTEWLSSCGDRFTIGPVNEHSQPKTHAWQHSRKAQGCTFFVQCKNLEKIGFSSCNPVAPCLLFEHRRTESHRKVAAIRVLCPRSSGLTQMTRSTESGCSMLHFIFGDRQKIQLCQLRPELIWPVA